MALNARQKRLYVHTCDLYKPSAITTDPVTKRSKPGGFPAQPTYANVACFFVSTTETVVTKPQGRTREDNLLTFDMFRFDVAQEIGDTWVIHFTTPNHPDAGGWWYVEGGPFSRPATTGGRNVNATEVYARHGPKPPGVA